MVMPRKTGIKMLNGTGKLVALDTQQNARYQESKRGWNTIDPMSLFQKFLLFDELEHLVALVRDAADDDRQMGILLIAGSDCIIMLLLICLQNYAIKKKKAWLNRSKPRLFVSFMPIKT